MSADRTTISRLGGYSRWKKEDPRPAMAKVREGYQARFYNEVDPNRELDPQERERRATAALRAHMIRLSLASAKKRKAAEE